MQRAPSLPSGLCLYAIGDIHGRLDLLEVLLKKIGEDAKVHSAHNKKIFLGDYIDRGLYSRQVIERLITLRDAENEPPVFLLGNHEQVMRNLLRDRDPALMADWLRFGGRETLLSYGVRPPTTPTPDQLAGLLDEFTTACPPAHYDFLKSLAHWSEFGDYFFCHAGVRPGTPLHRQNEQDLAWIRRDFLPHAGSYGRIIVHGHTICPEVEFMPNRINLDTGAYATGKLTALGLEGSERWLIQTN